MSDSLICFVFEFVEILRVFLVFLLDDLEIRLHGVHADHVVVLGEVHAVDAAGVAAHGAHFGFAEQDGLAFVAGEENHLLAVGELRADQLVLLVEIDGDDAGGARIGEFGERRLLHRAVLRGEEDVAAFLFQIARGNDGGQRFVFLESHQVGDAPCRAWPPPLREFRTPSASRRGPSR